MKLGFVVRWPEELRGDLILLKNTNKPGDDARAYPPCDIIALMGGGHATLRHVADCFIAFLICVICDICGDLSSLST